MAMSWLEGVTHEQDPDRFIHIHADSVAEVGRVFSRGRLDLDTANLTQLDFTRTEVDMSFNTVVTGAHISFAPRSVMVGGARCLVPVHLRATPVVTMVSREGLVIFTIGEARGVTDGPFPFRDFLGACAKLAVPAGGSQQGIVLSGKAVRTIVAPAGVGTGKILERYRVLGFDAESDRFIGIDEAGTLSLQPGELAAGDPIKLDDASAWVQVPNFSGRYVLGLGRPAYFEGEIHLPIRTNEGCGIVIITSRNGMKAYLRLSPEHPNDLVLGLTRDSDGTPLLIMAAEDRTVTYRSLNDAPHYKEYAVLAA